MVYPEGGQERGGKSLISRKLSEVLTCEQRQTADAATKEPKSFSVAVPASRRVWDPANGTAIRSPQTTETMGNTASLEVTPDRLTFVLTPKEATPEATLTLRHTAAGASHSRPVAFKVKTTQPTRYLVRPNQGLIQPGQSATVQILLVEKDKASLRQSYERSGQSALDSSKDKFLVQSTSVAPEENLTAGDYEKLSQFWTKVMTNRSPQGVFNAKLPVKLLTQEYGLEAPSTSVRSAKQTTEHPSYGTTIRLLQTASMGNTTSFETDQLEVTPDDTTFTLMPKETTPKATLDRLEVTPHELTFVLTPKEATSKATLTLKHPAGESHSQPVAFKVMTTQPRRYLVHPNLGLIQPGQSATVQILLVEKDKVSLWQSYEHSGQSALDSSDDKFLVQSTSVAPEENLTAGNYEKLSQFWTKVRTNKSPHLVVSNTKLPVKLLAQQGLLLTLEDGAETPSASTRLADLPALETDVTADERMKLLS